MTKEIVKVSSPNTLPLGYTSGVPTAKPSLSRKWEMNKNAAKEMVKVSPPNAHARPLTILITLLTLLTLTSCVTLPDTEVAQTQTRQVIGYITPSQSISQTITARRPNLNGVTLWFEPEDAEGQLHVQLRDSSIAPSLATTTLNIANLPQHGSTQVAFPPQPDSADKVYYLEVSTQAGDVKILGRDDDVYPEGRAFLNAVPASGDIAFRLTYAYTLSNFWADLGVVTADLWLSLPLALILFIPGWLLITWTKLRSRFDFGEQIALSLGLSLAIIPLLMLWTTTLAKGTPSANLAWTQTGVLIAGGLLLLLVALQILKHPPTSTPKFEFRISKFPLPTPHSPSRSISEGRLRHLHAAALIAIFILSLSVRLIMVRDLAAPAWVDSVHHSLITRFIIQEGGFPASYAPHFPPDVNYYHVGYHSVLATFTWLTNLSIPQAMLILGQVLNALTVFAVYAFTLTLTEKKTASLIAALITGLFTPMPAYYTTWGRYTQLAGLLILPAGLAWAKLVRRPSLLPSLLPSPPAPLPQGEGGSSLSLWERVRVRAGLILLAALTFGGLFLVHYRSTAFLGALLLAYALVEISFPSSTDVESRLSVLKNFSKTLLPAGLLAFALTTPWLFPTLAGLILPKAQAWSGEVKALFEDFDPRYLTAGLGTYTLVLAGLGLVLAFLRKKRFALTLTLWIVILFALANVGALGLPGNGFINNTSVEITLFMPISLLGGYLISEVIDFCLSKLQGKWKVFARWGFVALLAVAIIFAIPRILTVLNPSTVFFHAEDKEAIAWIDENIPPEETILINPTGWGYGLSRGEDGGAWIPPLAGNPTMPPPVLYGLGAEKRLYVNQFVTAIQTTYQNPGELAQVLTGYEVRFLYIGRHGGILSHALLSESAYFECLYENEGTWVFEVVGKP